MKEWQDCKFQEKKKIETSTSLAPSSINTPVNKTATQIKKNIGRIIKDKK